MTLTQRDWENIAAARLGEHALAVKVTMHTSRVHIDVTPETGKAVVCANAMRALVSDYASDMRVTWLTV